MAVHSHRHETDHHVNLNLSGPTSNETVHKTSVPLPQRTESMSNMKTNQLMPMGKVTAIYSKNHTKYIKVLC